MIAIVNSCGTMWSRDIYTKWLHSPGRIVGSTSPTGRAPQTAARGARGGIGGGRRWRWQLERVHQIGILNQRLEKQSNACTGETDGAAGNWKSKNIQNNEIFTKVIFYFY